jgi:hypothetical protein
LNVEKDLIFAGIPPLIIKNPPLKKKVDTGVKINERGRPAIA